VPDWLSSRDPMRFSEFTTSVIFFVAVCTFGFVALVCKHVAFFSTFDATVLVYNSNYQLKQMS
jgi:energy-converting hydrogenase Eha subunit A